MALFSAMAAHAVWTWAVMMAAPAHAVLALWMSARALWNEAARRSTVVPAASVRRVRGFSSAMKALVTRSAEAVAVAIAVLPAGVPLVVFVAVDLLRSSLRPAFSSLRRAAHLKGAAVDLAATAGVADLPRG